MEDFVTQTVVTLLEGLFIECLQGGNTGQTATHRLPVLRMSDLTITRYGVLPQLADSRLTQCNMTAHGRRVADRPFTTPTSPSRRNVPRSTSAIHTARGKEGRMRIPTVYCGSIFRKERIYLFTLSQI